MRIFNAINERKKEDPLVGLKIGSQELLEKLCAALKNEKGVHVETLLAILGALGGYSCHQAIHEEFVQKSKHQEKDVFMIVVDKNGKKYYYGDSVNKLLLENQYSIWSLVAAMSTHLTPEALPDISEIASHVAGTIGEPEFGIPRIPDEHKSGDIPVNYVKNLWENLFPTVNSFCDYPNQRPLLFGLAIQQVMNMGKDVIAPNVAAKIVMECALPMSKIGPEWINS